MAAAIAARGRRAAHVHADETSWQVFEDVDGKDGHRWWLWTFVTSETSVFVWTPPAAPMLPPASWASTGNNQSWRPAGPALLRRRTWKEIKRPAGCSLYTPGDPDLVMPTRLGNVLRRYEMLAGRQYELKVLTVLPHMALAGRPEDVRYLDDQRIQLDLAVRMCFTAVLATFISGSLLWRDGMWLLIVPIPGALAYVAYRGAVVSAREYGVAMTTLIDMNRFALYERLHLPMSKDIEEERKNNRRVMKLMEANSLHIFIGYRHPSAAIPGQPPPSVP